MRVIAGAHRGRRLRAPEGASTRPVMDRVKESLFSSISAEVPGASVLDLYAGAGSFGIEAMSRGAAVVTFVESDRRALEALAENLTILDIDADVIRMRVERWLETGIDRTYGLVFCDPPWPDPSEQVGRRLEALASRLDDDALVVVTRRTGDDVPEPGGYAISDVRAHGGTTIIRYVIDR